MWYKKDGRASGFPWDAGPHRGWVLSPGQLPMLASRFYKNETSQNKNKTKHFQVLVRYRSVKKQTKTTIKLVFKWLNYITISVPWAIRMYALHSILKCFSMYFKLSISFHQMWTTDFHDRFLILLMLSLHSWGTFLENFFIRKF